MPIANQYLPPVITIPSALQITAITQAYPMVVTVTNNTDQENTYIPGQLVRLMIPQPFGMIQANGLTGKIISVGTSTLTLNIDSSSFDSFVVPSGNVTQPASLAPAGSRNLEFNNFTRKVAFQSLNNIGN